MSRDFKKDNTKMIISLGFLAVFVLMVTVLSISMTTMHSDSAEMSELINQTTRKTQLAYQMRDAIRIRTNSIRSVLQITDPTDRERVFDTLVNSTQSYLDDREELIRLGSNEREQGILANISDTDERVSSVYEKANNNIFDKAGNTESLKSVIGEVRLQELVLLNHLNDLVKLEQTLAEETLAANRKRNAITQKLLLTLMVVAFLLSMFISFVVTQRVSRANRKIAHLANHDDLTGLNNRRSFEEQLQVTMNRAQRLDTHFGLMFIDLDRFKIINDTCGHHAGDQLLIQITSLINERLRKGDMLARVGGDELAVIAQGNSFKEIETLAEELRQIVADFTFVYSGQSFNVSLSIGLIAVDGKTKDIERMLSDVDSACYVAKQSGRNRVHVSQENDAEVVKYRNDIAGVQNIRQALANNNLVLFHQPVFRITEDSCERAHSEILLRIRSETGELFSPAEFIPLAEKYNIMTEIDRWVITNVIDWLIKHKHDIEDPHLLVNLSGLSFVNEDFMSFVVDELQNSGIDPLCMSFEITETAAVDNLDKAHTFIDAIRAMGCRIALDDFGTGFSTFAYLKQLPIDFLKIDGSLVKNIVTDSIDKEMVRAINSIGHTVGAKTIAEFVESMETVELLRELKVDYAQGYGLQKPAPLETLADDLALNKEPYKKAS